MYPYFEDTVVGTGDDFGVCRCCSRSTVFTEFHSAPSNTANCDLPTETNSVVGTVDVEDFDDDDNAWQ